ncbi:MAG: glycosyl hydrolase family 28-related protein [Verrucomicrobiota bacterium]
MNLESISRRRLLRHTTLAAAAGALGASLNPPNVSAAVPEGASSAKPGQLNVRDFGAVGDGNKDDTAAFASALKAAAETGAYDVFVPRGSYLIKGQLDIPENVVLEGVFRAPTARTQNAGSTLLAVAGAGEPSGPPFITLHQNSTLHGLTVFYPDQKQKNPPVAYPWTVRGIGDNCSLVDVLLVNPYQAVDFGTAPAGRHYIKGLYAQPLYRGLFIDQCFDVGRVEDVHFWPFWGGWDAALYEFVREEGIAFIIGRTDWEYLFNCFCIGYRVGYQFIQTKAGAPNCVLTQCGSDIGPTAVRVESCQGHAGLSFVNGQFMAGIEVKETNKGPVKFTACGFWNVPSTDNHAVLAGTGHTTFNGCHFIGWGQKNAEAPAIHARRGGLTVTACDFMDKGKVQVAIEPEVEAALVFGNRLRGQERIVNRAAARAQIGLNVVSDSQPAK